MKKKIVLLILTFFCFLNFYQVNAANNYELNPENICDYIKEKIEKYENAKKDADTYCSDNKNATYVKKCNEANGIISNSVIDIMKYNDSELKCAVYDEAVEEVILANSENCSAVEPEEIKTALYTILDIIHIAVPILLILMCSIDFAKAVISHEDGALNSAFSSSIKRAIAAIVVFFVPYLVNSIVGLVDPSFTGKYYSCDPKVVQQYRERLDKEYASYSGGNNFSSNNSYNNLYVHNYSGSDIIVKTADEFHEVMEKNSWNYSLTSSGLYWNNIKQSTYNPKKGTCCAAYVASVLYLSGAFTEDELNSTNYNHSPTFYKFFKKSGWTEIFDYSALKPGDIVFMSTSKSSVGHVQIFHGTDSKGNYLWYNAGLQKYVRGAAPYSSNAKDRFHSAFRKV